MKHLFSTPPTTIFLDHFERHLVRILRNRLNGEILFESESVARCLGFQNEPDMMRDDRVLDTISNHIKQDRRGQFCMPPIYVGSLSG